MADGWDLHAVVSGCTAAASSSSTVTVNGQTNRVEDPLPDLASLTFANDDDTPFYYPGFGDNSDFEFEGTLEEIYRSFNFLKPRPNNPSTSSISLTQQEARSRPPPPPPLSQKRVQVQQLITPQLIKNSRVGSSLALPAAVRSRRRKNQQTKLVRQLSHEELLGDSWAWRKYGQKPIKGSPYPRNYYRCSTSKGCGARKQVEKSPADPEVYVVSYSGEHTHPRPTHRNSLAGTTRAKFSSRPAAAAGASSEQPSTAAAVPNPPRSSSSPVSASSLSPSTPLIEGESSAAPPENSLTETIEILDDDGDDDDGMGETEYDEVVLIPNTVMSEDILKGFEELRRANSGSARFDQTRDNSPSPWNFSSAAAAGGGGGC